MLGVSHGIFCWPPIQSNRAKSISCRWCRSADQFNMADEEHTEGVEVAVDASGLVAGDDQHVDESLLKLPTGVTFAGKEASGEESEEVLCKL